MRLVIFADGKVGAGAVEIARELDPHSLVGVLTPESFPDPQAIAELKPDVVILAWWPTILKGPMLELGQRYMLNFHPSLLPYCRGKDPNFWALKLGQPFGVTIHHVTSGIDSGDIAFQREIPYTWEDTGETLYRKAMAGILGLFRESYPRIAAFDIPRIGQHADLGYHKRSELDPQSEITLDGMYSGRDLLNLLRARTFSPHPASWFVDGGKRYQVRVEITECQ
jgi:methionyl-tRNA formyltransferase